MSVRIDRLQLGLVEAFTPLAQTAWAHQEQPRGDDPLISLSLVSGPSAHLQSHARGELLLPADSIVVTVTTATVGALYVVALNGFDYRHEAIGGDTTTTIRDALLAQVQAGEVGFVTAAANGAAAITLTGVFLGGLRHLTLHGPLSAGVPVVSGDAVLETVGTATLLVGVQCFAKDRTPRNGAYALAHAAWSRLQRVGVAEALGRYGVALWDKGSVQDLAAVAGGHWEPRAVFDLTVGMRNVEIEPVHQLETATLNFSVTV